MEIDSVKAELNRLLALYDDDGANEDDLVFSTFDFVRRTHNVAQMLLLEGRFPELQRCLHLCEAAFDVPTLAAEVKPRPSEANSRPSDTSTHPSVAFSSSDGTAAVAAAITNGLYRGDSIANTDVESDGSRDVDGLIASRRASDEAAAAALVRLVRRVTSANDAPLVLPPQRATGDRCTDRPSGIVTSLRLLHHHRQLHLRNKDDLRLFNALQSRTQQLQRQLDFEMRVRRGRDTEYYMQKLGLHGANGSISEEAQRRSTAFGSVERTISPLESEWSPAPPERGVSIGHRAHFNKWMITKELPPLVTNAKDFCAGNGGSASRRTTRRPQTSLNTLDAILRGDIKDSDYVEEEDSTSDDNGLKAVEMFYGISSERSTPLYARSVPTDLRLWSSSSSSSTPPPSSAVSSSRGDSPAYPLSSHGTFINVRTSPSSEWHMENVSAVPNGHRPISGTVATMLSEESPDINTTLRVSTSIKNPATTKQCRRKTVPQPRRRTVEMRRHAPSSPVIRVVPAPLPVADPLSTTTTGDPTKSSLDQPTRLTTLPPTGPTAVPNASPISGVIDTARKVAHYTMVEVEAHCQRSAKALQQCSNLRHLQRLTALEQKETSLVDPASFDHDNAAEVEQPASPDGHRPRTSSFTQAGVGAVECKTLTRAAVGQLQALRAYQKDQLAAVKGQTESMMEKWQGQQRFLRPQLPPPLLEGLDEWRRSGKRRTTSHSRLSQGSHVRRSRQGRSSRVVRLSELVDGPAQRVQPASSLDGGSVSAHLCGLYAPSIWSSMTVSASPNEPHSIEMAALSAHPLMQATPLLRSRQTIELLAASQDAESKIEDRSELSEVGPFSKNVNTIATRHRSEDLTHSLAEVPSRPFTRSRSAAGSVVWLNGSASPKADAQNISGSAVAPHSLSAAPSTPVEEDLPVPHYTYHPSVQALVAHRLGLPQDESGEAADGHSGHSTLLSGVYHNDTEYTEEALKSFRHLIDVVSHDTDEGGRSLASHSMNASVHLPPIHRAILPPSAESCRAVTNRSAVLSSIYSPAAATKAQVIRKAVGKVLGDVSKKVANSADPLRDEGKHLGTHLSSHHSHLRLHELTLQPIKADVLGDSKGSSHPNSYTFPAAGGQWGKSTTAGICRAHVGNGDLHAGELYLVNGVDVAHLDHHSELALTSSLGSWAAIPGALTSGALRQGVVDWTSLSPLLLMRCLPLSIVTVRLQRWWRGHLAMSIKRQRQAAVLQRLLLEERRDTAAMTMQRSIRTLWARRTTAAHRFRCAAQIEKRVHDEAAANTSAGRNTVGQWTLSTSWKSGGGAAGSTTRPPTILAQSASTAVDRRSTVSSFDASYQRSSYSVSAYSGTSESQLRFHSVSDDAPFSLFAHSARAAVLQELRDRNTVPASQAAQHSSRHLSNAAGFSILTDRSSLSMKPRQTTTLRRQHAPSVCLPSDQSTERQAGSTYNPAQREAAARRLQRWYRCHRAMDVARLEHEVGVFASFLAHRDRKGCGVANVGSSGIRAPVSSATTTLSTVLSRTTTELWGEELPVCDVLERCSGDVYAAFLKRREAARLQGDYQTPLQRVNLRELQLMKQHREENEQRQRLLSERERLRRDDEVRMREHMRLAAVLQIQQTGRGYRHRRWLLERLQRRYHKNSHRRAEFLLSPDISHQHHAAQGASSSGTSDVGTSEYLQHMLGGGEAIQNHLLRAIQQRHPDLFVSDVDHDTAAWMAQHTTPEMRGASSVVSSFFCAFVSRAVVYEQCLHHHARLIQLAWRSYRERRDERRGRRRRVAQHLPESG